MVCVRLPGDPSHLKVCVMSRGNNLRVVIRSGPLQDPLAGISDHKQRYN